MTIKIRYSSVDRYSESRSFKTIEAARRYARKWVGPNPEVGSFYAVSGDGIGKVTVSGAPIGDIFPEAS